MIYRVIDIASGGEFVRFLKSGQEFFLIDVPESLVGKLLQSNGTVSIPTNKPNYMIEGRYMFEPYAQNEYLTYLLQQIAIYRKRLLSPIPFIKDTFEAHDLLFENVNRLFAKIDVAIANNSGQLALLFDRRDETVPDFHSFSIAEHFGVHSETGVQQENE